MPKEKAEYRKPELRTVALVPSEALLTACKTSSGYVVECFCDNHCHKWLGGFITTQCKDAGS